MDGQVRKGSMPGLRVAVSLACVLFTPVLLPLFLSPVWGQAPDAASQPAAPSGPVDIQANEQEFSGDEILAKGNVKVTYKDTVITGPEAVLERNAGGSPQSAVFKGHPHLVQNGAVMDSDILKFDIANHGIEADGHAHSEVVSSESTSGAQQGAKTKPAVATTSGAGTGSKTVNGDGVTGAPGQQNSDEQQLANVSQFPAQLGVKRPDAAAGNVQEKIITDSDRQEYDQNSDKFMAYGHVRVKHADIKVSADKLQLVYGANKKPETAIFTGKAIAKQGKNITRADVVTYNLTTRRLQATGHVRSKVVQEKAEANTDNNKNSQPPKVAYGPGAATAATISGSSTAMGTSGSSNNDPNNDKLKGGVSANEENIYILSDSQDYNKQTGRICADGNVKIYYEDSVGAGPRAVLVRGENGKAEKIIFTGRSQVNQPHKWWIGDQIVMIVTNKHVIAQGNTRAYVERTPVSELKKKKEQKSAPDDKERNSQLASRSKASQELSAARIEAAR